MYEYLMNLQSAYDHALNGSSAIRRFEGSEAVDTDGITFDFYTGLPHIKSHERCMYTEGIYDEDERGGGGGIVLMVVVYIHCVDRLNIKTF